MKTALHDRVDGGITRGEVCAVVQSALEAFMLKRGSVGDGLSVGVGVAPMVLHIGDDRFEVRVIRIGESA